eukprot:SAG31_NODE_1121_length_9797_cov_16.183749_3_plen_79_part_00
MESAAVDIAPGYQMAEDQSTRIMAMAGRANESLARTKRCEIAPVAFRNAQRPPAFRFGCVSQDACGSGGDWGKRAGNA